MTDQISKCQAYLDEQHEKAEFVELGDGQAAVFSRRSPYKETANEDAALVVSMGGDSGVLAVADGCGGMAGGAQASRLTIEDLGEAVRQGIESGRSLRAAVLDGIEQANRRVLDLGTGAAATLAVVEIEKGNIRTYHVGDSQVLLVGNRGKVKLQTRSHAPVAYAVEAGMLSEEEAMHHEDRHLVSNVVGTRDMHIEIGPHRRMSPRDTLLVASDGVFDNLHVDEIVEIIRKGPHREAAARLVEVISDRMESPNSQHPCKPDDLTFILFRMARDS